MIGPFGRDGAEESTVRVLASVIPGTGHLLPLLPTLHALRDAGDTVLVASAEPLRAEVEAAGLDFAAVGPPWHESDADALLPGFRTAGSVRQLGMFAALAPAVVPDLLALADDVRPQLLLREPYEFAAWLAAERSGLPMVVHAIGVVTGSPVLFAALAGESLASARTATGLPADPDLGSLYGRGMITFYPASLRFLQPPPSDVPQQPIRLPPPGPAWLPFERVRPGRPLVYVTLGTVFNTAVDLLRTLVAGVAALDVEVVTTGQTVDSAMLGPQPAHVHAAHFVPQQDVLAAAAAVVCHAGWGRSTAPSRSGCRWWWRPCPPISRSAPWAACLQVPPCPWHPSRHRRSSWPTRLTQLRSRPPRSARRPCVCWRLLPPPGRSADRC
jgi:hypothetical protein